MHLILDLCVFVVGGACGLWLSLWAERKGLSRTSRFHPLARVRRGLRAVTPSRKSHTSRKSWLEQDEHRYITLPTPARPRYPKSIEPDNRPRLTPPTCRSARLAQIEEVMNGPGPMVERLQELADIVRAQQGRVGLDGKWMPRSLDDDGNDDPVTN